MWRYQWTTGVPVDPPSRTGRTRHRPPDGGKKGRGTFGVKKILTLSESLVGSGGPREDLASSHLLTDPPRTPNDPRCRGRPGLLLPSTPLPYPTVPYWADPRGRAKIVKGYPMRKGNGRARGTEPAQSTVPFESFSCPVPRLLSF